MSIEIRSGVSPGTLGMAAYSIGRQQGQQRAADKTYKLAEERWKYQRQQMMEQARMAQQYGLSQQHMMAGLWGQQLGITAADKRAEAGLTQQQKQFEARQQQDKDEAEKERKARDAIAKLPARTPAVPPATDPFSPQLPPGVVWPGEGGGAQPPAARGGPGVPVPMPGGPKWGPDPSNNVPLDENGLPPMAVLPTDPPIYVMQDGSKIRGRPAGGGAAPAAAQPAPPYQPPLRLGGAGLLGPIGATGAPGEAPGAAAPAAAAGWPAGWAALNAPPAGPVTDMSAPAAAAGIPAPAPAGAQPPAAQPAQAPAAQATAGVPYALQPSTGKPGASRAFIPPSGLQPRPGGNPGIMVDPKTGWKWMDGYPIDEATGQPILGIAPGGQKILSLVGIIPDSQFESDGRDAPATLPKKLPGYLGDPRLESDWDRFARGVRQRIAPPAYSSRN